MAPVGPGNGGSARAKGDSNQEDNDIDKSIARTGSSTSTACSCYDDLVRIAAKAKVATEWEAILLSARAGPGRWKTDHKIGDFEVYHRQEAHRYGVLATGLVPGYSAEILNVLQCANSAQYAPQMEAIFGDQFKNGECLSRVDLPPQDADASGSELVELIAKMVTFTKASWLAQHEQWCYLDGVYRNPTSGATEKVMTPIDPRDVGLERDRDKRLLRDISCAYLLLPEPQQPPVKPNQDGDTSSKPLTSTRVYFYGEYLIPKQVSASMQALGSEKISRQRLLKLADSNTRLTALIKRRRLGLQTLVDSKRFLPPTNTPCRLCTKVLLVAKVCRLCGHSVCKQCSKKHERAGQPHGSESIKVAKVRVCACCMERVDRGIYENVKASSLFGPRILPDPEDSPATDSILQRLLHEELSTSSSPSRKACVISVIQYLQGDDTDTRSCRSKSSSQYSEASNYKDEDDFDAVLRVHVDRIPHDQAVYRTGEDRSYRLDTEDPASVLNAPMAEQEDERLRAVARVDMDQLCEEMNCLYSTISIFDLDNLNCVASNVAMFERAKMPRGNTAVPTRSSTRSRISCPTSKPISASRMPWS